MGFTPDVAYSMTPRQISAASVGYKERLKVDWAQTLRITQAWGDKLTVKKLFRGPKSAEQRQKDLENLVERFSPILDEKGIEYQKPKQDDAVE